MLDLKSKKRLRKLKGSLNYLCSVISLKYSRQNTDRLKRQIRALKVDRLHVGCGDIIIKDWLNIFYDTKEIYGVLRIKDGTVVLNYDLLEPWPIDDESIDFVAGSHFIEHMDLNRCLDFLSEAHRVLRTNGVLRLSCPDLEKYARHYIEGNEGFFNDREVAGACTFKNAQTPSQIFAAKAYDSGGAHKWFHDYTSLANCLVRAGFANVKKLSRLEGQTPDIAKIEAPAREIETLYVEARKK